jgi:hypothetical protein
MPAKNNISDGLRRTICDGRWKGYLMNGSKVSEKEKEEWEGKCHILWLLNGGKTEEWNGEGCDCPYSMGQLVCKRMEWEDVV